MELMPGIARKISILVVMVSLLGWILYIVGFAAVNNSSNYKTNITYVPPSGQNCRDLSFARIPSQRAGLYWFPHWVVVIGGPFLYICTLLHLIFAKWFTGILTNFLTVLYLVCGGAVIYTWAVELFDSSALIAVRNYCPPDGWYTDLEWGLWPIIEWVGCLVSVLFLTGYIMMWPCFRPRRCVRSEEAGEEYYGEEEYEQEYQEEEQDEEEEQKDETEEPQETTVE